ncbi:MAG: hypothetical protein R3F46_00455 [bacterium]
MQRAFRVLSCLFLTVLLAACATSSRIDSARDPALPGQSPGAATLRPDSSGLPALAALDGLVEAAGNRETSEICEIGNIQGRDFLAKSDNAFVTEDHKLLLTSTSGSHAWAVYEAFNAGSEISSCVLFASALAPGYYIALPDFTIGRWEFSELNPPNGNPFTIDLEAAERISPKQRQYFALVAVDGGQLLVDYALSNIKCISPQDSSVATTPFRELELLDCGGRPGLFFNSDEQQLRFGLAGSSAPAGPEDWQFSTVDSGNVGGIMQAVLHQGRPVVLYASFEDESLWLAWSGKAQPLADSDWQRRQLVPGANCKYCSIASSGDRLHIAWFRNDPLDSDVDNFYGYLDYGYTSGSDPQDSFSSYRLAELGNSSFAEFARPALALIDAEPAIAIVNVIPGVENRLLFL